MNCLYLIVLFGGGMLMYSIGGMPLLFFFTLVMFVGKGLFLGDGGNGGGQQGGGYSGNGGYGNGYWGGYGGDPARDYKYCMLILLSEVMKANGRLKHSELDVVKMTIRRYFKTYEEQKAALLAFKEMLNKDNDVDMTCIRMNGVGTAVKMEIIVELYAVAYADGEFTKEEFKAIFGIGVMLSLTPQQIKTAEYVYKARSAKGYYGAEYDNYSRQRGGEERQEQTRRNVKTKEWALGVMGLESGATAEEVKKKYKELAKQYHPDKWANMGEEAQRGANETFQQINEAYEVLKGAMGIK